MIATSKRCAVGLAAAWLTAAQTAAPRVPEALKPPAGQVVVWKALGQGKQIYECQNGQWVLERPQAELLDAQGKRAGRHYEGPTWEALDGSKVVGEVQSRAEAPKKGAVPWLLLKAKSAAGSGVLGHVTFIQRVNTSGGAAPTDGCDREHGGREAAIDYQADYYFYAPAR